MITNWIRSSIKCFDQSLKAINSLFMYYYKQEKHIWVFSVEKDCFQVLNIHVKLWVFSRESGIWLHLYWFQIVLLTSVICFKHFVNSSVVANECCVLLRLSRSTFLVCVVPKGVCFLKGSRSLLWWFCV